ncbi:MAG: hypothetical protein KJ944_08540 [Alphaproteobacteria bacterium]|nr:hypothetical protein [Alphaproteobacteria bacterium]MBU1561537.1 hypothetical protein [Alphaproteobacteria bacterium]MBU2302630.1 hypothetical protein [Alphaproteobacteria bacterium]MBU2367704.1 hypothetical protein [Alphaproteobacteria bacterium]
MTNITKATAAARRQRMIDIGIALHGERYGAPLAAGMGVSQPVVANIVGGRRDMTDDQDRKLVAHARAVLQSRRDALQKVADHIDDLDKELGNASVSVSSPVLPVGVTARPPRKPMVMPTLGRKPAPEPELDEPDPGLKP